MQITDLFARPREGLHVLAREWLGAVKRGPAWQRRCINENPEDYTPTAAYYANFALTYSGLAVGQFMEPACIRTVATVPYAVLRPQLSALGRRLVDGVRAPKWSYGP